MSSRNQPPKPKLYTARRDAHRALLAGMLERLGRTPTAAERNLLSQRAWEQAEQQVKKANGGGDA